MSPTTAKWIGRAAAAVLVFFAVAYARVVYESKAFYFRGEGALQASRTEDAVFFFRTSAAWYAPFNPYVGKSHDRLWQLGRKAELRGDSDAALECYRALRSSILAVRSFYTPATAMLGRANERIAALMSRKTHPPAFEGKSREEIRRLHFGLLEEVPQPDPGWSLVLIAGFFLWTGSIVAFIFTAVGPTLRVARGPFLKCLLAFFVGMVMWIAGMFMA